MQRFVQNLTDEVPPGHVQRFLEFRIQQIAPRVLAQLLQTGFRAFIQRDRPFAGAHGTFFRDQLDELPGESRQCLPSRGVHTDHRDQHFVDPRLLQGQPMGREPVGELLAEVADTVFELAVKLFDVVHVVDH